MIINKLIGFVKRLNVIFIWQMQVSLQAVVINAFFRKIDSENRSGKEGTIRDNDKITQIKKSLMA